MKRLRRRVLPKFVRRKRNKRRKSAEKLRSLRVPRRKKIKRSCVRRRNRKS